MIPLPTLLRQWRGVNPATGRGIISQPKAAEFFQLPLRTYQDIEAGKTTSFEGIIRLVLELHPRPPKSKTTRPVVLRE